jgi:hypothetical protein
MVRGVTNIYWTMANFIFHAEEIGEEENLEMEGDLEIEECR